MLCLLVSCNDTRPVIGAQAAPLPPVKGRICGLTLVAPPEPFPADPMPAITATGANWVAVVPYAYTRLGSPTVRYNEHGRQWWGERPEGVLATIETAHAAGVKVMLKPQVYVPNGWTGTLDFDTDEQWSAWEADYKRYVLGMARIAAAAEVEMFCIGTEFRTAIARRPDFWLGLIGELRTLLPGVKLVYSANWDDWDQVPFWAALDYIGIGAYFPLAQGDEPSVDSLLAAWKPLCKQLGDFSKKWDKPVLFTEYGYLSVNGTGWQNWELERGIELRPINEQAQANCYEALFRACMKEPWWAGGFAWKWFPNGRGHEGYVERDYTPQGKRAEEVLKKWYRQAQ